MFMICSSEMNSSSPQKEISAISRNSLFAGGNGHAVVCSATQSPTNNGQDQKPHKKVQVKYMECLKNHAAAIGGSATDGCGEFMPSGDEGTIEALKCSACNCHRNFHRKELECDCPASECHHNPNPVLNNNGGRALLLGHQNHLVASSQGYPPSTFISIGAAEPPLHHHHQLIMPYKSGSAASESDDKDDGGGDVVVARPLEKLKKRFRTKFTQEQKEKMLNFAEKAGWRIQKLEESIVQQFCQEIGIKRRVLKVWMHNNKHSLAKKNSINTS